MVGLQILLLGGFNVQRGDEPLPPIPSRVGRSLFAYLVVNRARAHPREELVAIFWPDLPESRGRRRLSHTLWQIQDALGEQPGGRPHLETSTDRLRFNTDASYWLDVEDFERHLEALDAGASAATRTASLRHAVELYRGDFMSGFYDEWVLVEQERLGQLHLRALGELVELAKSRGDYEEALLYARRLTNHDPLREDAHREVMRLCVLLGRTSEALRQFERCRSVLFEELEAEPAADTVELYERIRRQRRVGPEPSPGTTSSSRPVRTDVPLVGRDRERGVLVDELEEVLTGRGGVVLLEGEPGVGKTRLLLEISEDARWRGLSVLWGTGRDGGGTQPYGLLVEALSGELNPLRIEQLAPRLEPVWLREAGRLLPALRRVAASSDLDGVSGAEASERMRESLVRLLVELGRISPSVLVLDDLHWADRETLDAVEALADRLDGTRLLLVIAYRGQDARDSHRVWEVVRRVDRETRPRRVLLEPLTPFGTAELIRGALRTRGVSSTAVNRLHRDTGGNPLFVLEMLRSLDEAGRGPSDLPDDAGDAALSADVRDVIATRLTRLGAEARETLATAAVIGTDVALATLAAAADATRTEVLDAVQDLAARGLLRIEGDHCAFQHDLTRRVVTEWLSVRERHDLHRRVARAVEQLEPERHAELAHHFEAAALPREALQHHRLAGRAALEVHGYATAALHLDRAIELMDDVLLDVADRFELLLSFEEVASVLARRDDQAAALDRLTPLAQGHPGREMTVLRRRAWLGAHTARFEEALDTIAHARRLASELDDGGALEEALVAEGTILLWAGRLEPAVDSLRRAVDLAEGRTDRREADAHRALGDALRNLQRYDEAARHLGTALDIYRQHGDLPGQASAESVLGAVLMETGRTEEAETHYERAIGRSREIGFRQLEGVSLMNLGNLLRVEGRAGGALARYEQAVGIMRELGNDRLEAIGLLNLASLRHAVLGDDERASEEADRARTFFSGTDESRTAAMALDTPAGIARRAGRLEDARRLVEQGLDLVGEDEGWVTVQLSRTLAEIELDAGDPAAALEILERARRTCDAFDLGEDQASGIDGLRAVALDQVDRSEEALRLVGQVAGDLGPGIDRPYLVHLWHHEILRRNGADAEGRAAIQRAHDLLMLTLDGLPEQYRELALRGVPEHVRIVDGWEWARPTTAPVTLARAEAPTGRPLRQDELIELVVTVQAPEDTEIADPIEQRRRRVLRVVEEAIDQGGMPTIADLSQLFEVSAATIRRDLAELRTRGHRIETRGSRAG